MKVLGVIPARGGSKRLPSKNILELGGKPLIQWAIDSAMESGVITTLVVSTESDEIAHTVLNNPANKQVRVHKRPPELAKDTTPSLPVIRDVFEHYPSDVVITLQCTSPLRTGKDILESLKILLESNGDAVISTTEAPKELAFEVGWAGRLREVPRVVVPNGAIYIIRGDKLKEGESWYSGVFYGYPMPKDRSIDIDTEQDLELVRYLVSKHGNGSTGK